LSFWLDQLDWIIPSRPVLVVGNRALMEVSGFGPAFVGARTGEAEQAIRTLGQRCLPTLLKRLRIKRTLLTDPIARASIWSARLHLSRHALSADYPRVIRLWTWRKMRTIPRFGSHALEVLRQLSPGDYAKISKAQQAASAIIQVH
jgi:hypothetical protein